MRIGHKKVIIPDNGPAPLFGAGINGNEFPYNIIIADGKVTNLSLIFEILRGRIRRKKWDLPKKRFEYCWRVTLRKADTWSMHAMYGTRYRKGIFTPVGFLISNVLAIILTILLTDVIQELLQKLWSVITRR